MLNRCLNIVGRFEIGTIVHKSYIRCQKAALEIFVDIFIFEVSKINDIELTMTFELYFDLMWEENRFVINKTSDKWGQVC